MITGLHILMIEHSVIFAMTGLIYNTALWAENEQIRRVLANGFSTNNLLDVCQEIIMMISQKK